PTPGIAYMTRRFHCDFGVVISASHNLYDDNGIKFFDATGGKLSDELEERIEADLQQLTVPGVRAHVGVALDGDGDRLVMVDHLGRIVDGDQLLCVLARAKQAEG